MIHYMTRASATALWEPLDTQIALRTSMELGGLRYSELGEHVKDVQAGHIVTAENGRQWSSQATPVLPPYRPSPTGLGLTIYRGPYGDCSLNGLSSLTDHVVLVGIVDRRQGDRAGGQPIPRAQAGPIKPSDDAPAVVLVIRNNGLGTTYSVEPLQPRGERRWFMMGGTYVSGDSRFSELTGRQYGAIAFHDRYEEGR